MVSLLSCFFLFSSFLFFSKLSFLQSACWNLLFQIVCLIFSSFLFRNTVYLVCIFLHYVNLNILPQPLFKIVSFFSYFEVRFLSFFVYFYFYKNPLRHVIVPLHFNSVRSLLFMIYSILFTYSSNPCFSFSMFSFHPYYHWLLTSIFFIFQSIYFIYLGYFLLLKIICSHASLFSFSFYGMWKRIAFLLFFFLSCLFHLSSPSFRIFYYQWFSLSYIIILFVI